jgi:MSHA pilin protein MshD
MGRRGFTLIELVISIVVIGIALSGTLLVIDTVTAHSADPMLAQQALAIGEAHLEEISLRGYLDPDDGNVCPAAEASRDLYDNVCDYDTLDDAGARDQDGNPIAGLDAYRVRVAVDQAATLGSLSGSAEVLRVDVRVTHPAGIDVTLSGYRTNR